MTSSADIFVVIPAFNEASAVGNVVRRVRRRFPNVVVVDDGSTDATASLAHRAGAVVVTHLINRGQGAALKTGIDYALSHGADIIVTFDSDGQHSVEDIDVLLTPIIEKGFEVVLGSRFLDSRSQVPAGRRLILKLGVLFTRLVSCVRVTDTHNGLRALTRQAAAQIEVRQDRMAHASEILDEIAKRHLNYCEVPTHVLYTDYSRDKGQSSAAAFGILLDFFAGRWEK